MFCKRIIYVNWGNIPNAEFDLGPINLFSGGNGSGKTTAADGIQALMTAAHENYFHFNPGQEETTQKGRGGKLVRTLASYVMGCDDGKYARLRMTDGYLAGIFHPTTGETAEPFTAVMSVRAKLDESAQPKQARQDDIKFLILPETELNLSDFISETITGKSIVTLDKVAQHFQLKIGKNFVEEYDKKGAYLRRLYGIFQGRNKTVSDTEAKHAAKSFSSFMAYKPVKSISDFVSNQVLEKKDISEDIRQVSELMKTIHGMEEETRTLKNAIESLDGAMSCANSYVTNWIDRAVAEYAVASVQCHSKQKSYVSKKKAQQDNQQQLSDTRQKIELANQEKQHYHDQLVELEAKRRGISELKTKDELEAQIETVNDNITHSAMKFMELNPQFHKNYAAAKELSHKLKQTSLGPDIPFIDSSAFLKPLKQVLEGPEESPIEASALFTKDWIDSRDLESALEAVSQLEASHTKLANTLHETANKPSTATDQTSKSLRDQVMVVYNAKEFQLQKTLQHVKQKEHEIKQLEASKVSYPLYVSVALDAIKTHCPEAKPAVLCDFIEVTDATWQMAIEGYMGGARFSILVEPEYEARAIRIVRNIKGKRNAAKVIQGSKAQRDAERTETPSQSILGVMSFSHKIAEYYVKASYGSVIRVQDEEALRNQRRGITPDGLGSGSYSMFRSDIDDGDLVFGQGARARALAAKTKEQLELSAQLSEVQTAYHRIGRIADLFDQIKTIECSSLITDLLSLNKEIKHYESKLDALDLTDFEALEVKLASVQALHKESDNTVQDMKAAEGKYLKEEEILKIELNKLSDEKDQLADQKDAKEQVVEGISTIYPDLDAEARLSEADTLASHSNNDADFADIIELANNSIELAERRLYEHVREHNAHNSRYNAILYPDLYHDKQDETRLKKFIELNHSIELVYNVLKNNVLVDKHEQLAGLKDTFNTAFVTNLCHSIYQAINQGKQTLDDLNTELESHVFGTDQERFSFEWDWVPEFREYYRFFKDIIKDPSLGDGTSLFDTELSEKSAAVRDRLLSMLLDKDSQSALRELERISDYRNYRRYEIYKTPLNKDKIALSTYGTGSGGQLETPAYIIRSAAITSAFKFNTGHSHCRMVLVDEAFSKMDETRSREVIHYLTEALGLQLIFIMPTSKSGPFLDLISHQIVFSKCPAEKKVGELETQVLVDRKVCNQDKIKALWANHRKTIRHQAELDFMADL